MNTTEITNHIKNVLKQHLDSRNALGKSIYALISPLPKGTKLKVGFQTLSIEEVVCGCSQWANGGWQLTGTAKAALVNGALVIDHNPEESDGSNIHYRRTPLFTLDDENHETPLEMASAKALRSLADGLPEALKDFMKETEIDTELTKEANLDLA